MRLIISILALGLLTGCVQEQQQPLPQNVAKPRYIAPKTAKWDNQYSNNYGSGCNWQTKDSITCRIKRIQSNLNRLEQNSISAMGGIGDCKSCGN